MAGRGRGRGRGLLTVKLKPPVPGGGNESETTAGEENPEKDVRAEQALKDLDNETEMLLSSENDPTEEDLQRMSELATMCMSTPTYIQNLAKCLYEKAVKKREHAKPLSIICDSICNIPKGAEFRGTMLGLIQSDFNNRKQLQSSNNSRFLGCVSFLCNLFGTIRLGNGVVLQALVEPIYDCFDLILENENITDTDTDCTLSLLQSIGRDLQDNNEERMNFLMCTVRSKIICETTLATVRCYLLELLELYMRRWQTLSNDVTRFYLDSMVEIMAGLVV